MTAELLREEVTVVLEPEGYSISALRVYESLGDVVLGGKVGRAWSVATSLVVRLGINLSEDFLSNFPQLKRIITPTTGVDHIDRKYCDHAGIKVYSLASVKDEILEITSTAELSLGLIISLVRNTHLASDAVVRDATWNRDTFKSRQLSNLTLGVIGFGRIGRMVTGYCLPIFESVLVFDIAVGEGDVLTGASSHASFSDVLMTSDVVTLHANASDGQPPIIGQRELEMMKPGAMLVNTARGSLVDENALVDAIQKKRIAGYACDVLQGEPFDDESIRMNPVWKLASERENIIISPHIGGCTTDAMDRTELLMAEYVARLVLEENE